MLDLRYHALSLVAVFLALAIGIVLGVTIGDSLVSDAQRSLQTGLRANVEDARNEARRARDDVRARDRMLDQLYPSLVRDRLRGERVALISWGPLPSGVEEGVRDAVQKGGGRLDSISTFDKPLRELRGIVGRGEFAAFGDDDSSLDELAQDLAHTLLGDDRLGVNLPDRLPDSFRGRYRHADAVVFYQAPDPADTEDEGFKERSDDRARRIQSAMLEQLEENTIASVGVEQSNTEPTQIGFYKSRKLSTVDSVDVSAGRMALVFVLAGATGNYGLKAGAKQPLPEEAVTSP
jgi:hypothetical protein